MSRWAPDEIEGLIPFDIQEEVGEIVDEFIKLFGPTGVPAGDMPGMHQTSIGADPPPVALSVWFQALAVWNARKLARLRESL